MKISDIKDDCSIDNLLCFSINNLINARAYLALSKNRDDMLSVIAALRKDANEMSKAADKWFAKINEEEI